MPGASSMRGVTGFRALDAVNGALAQLIPARVPAAGEGGNTLAVFGAERPDGGERFIFYELVVGTWGGTPLGRRQRRRHEPGEPRGEHPGRGRRVGVPDPDRALRARARQRRRGPAPRRPRGRARLALPDAGHVADRPLRPRGAPAVRPRGRRSRARCRRTCCSAPDGTRGGAAVDVLDHDRRGRRLRPSHGGRRRLGRSASAIRRDRDDVADGKVPGGEATTDVRESALWTCLRRTERSSARSSRAEKSADGTSQLRHGSRP